MAREDSDEDSEIAPIDLTAALLRIAVLDWQIEPSWYDPEVTEGIAEDFGGFSGLPPIVALLDDGRTAQLMSPLSYRRPDGSEWPVPAGAELDGASIPRPLWSLIGGPFEGRYRDASIVHDHYCVIQSAAWRATHRMFYEAMRCSGVGVVKAKIMYYAVYRFGPRWPEPEEAFAESIVAAEPLTDAEAPSLAADAEAIAVHDLSLAEVEALADARAAAADGGQVTEAVGGAAAALARARLLVVPGGSGGGEDLDAVAREAAFLPAPVMKRFERKKVRIVACRGSVTDFETRLRGVVPRGWEATGRTWDDVPGAYFPDRKRVVIATIGIGAGGERSVPTAASRLHGSESLIVHESLHGFDFIGGHAALRDAGFQGARNGDLARLGEYERQQGQAGLEETFAESGARFAVGPERMRQDWPNLFTYWQAGPLGGGIGEAPVGTIYADADTAADDAIGTAELTPDGTIVLDLRAEGEGGAIGHAMLTIAAGDPAHPALQQHLFADLPIEETTAGARVLFRLGGAARRAP